MKKYQDGGKTGAQLKKEGQAMKAKGEGMKLKGQGQAMKAKGQAMKSEGKAMKKIGSDVKPKTAMDGVKALGYHIKQGGVYKKGGPVKNAKLAALKSAGSKGVKSGVNPKATASKVARGRVGGTSTAPKTTIPKRK
jgi:hypothetical protein